MAEFLFIIIIGFIGIIFLGLLAVSWNIAKGGTDIMEYFGGHRGAGYSRNDITGEGAPRKKNPKWSKDGGLK